MCTMKSPAMKYWAVVVVLLAAVTWAKATNTTNTVEINHSVATIGGGGGGGGLDLPTRIPALW
jgi:hypothetical protein